jgi:Fe-S-cluster-containing hydrogenase component 2
MSKNNKLSRWKSKGHAAEGIPTLEELENTPGYCSLERLEKGPVAVIECIQEIPCNPCEIACHREAINIGSPITNLPVLNVDKCNGCGLCISLCPGLAIFTVDLTYNDESALVSLPFEFLPLPEVGDTVMTTDREGKEVCEGKVVKVVDKPRQGKTPVISVSVPKECALIVRGISIKKGKSSNDKSGVKSNANNLRISNHPILGQEEHRKEVTITMDGEKMTAREGEMIIAALLSAGIRINRFTAKYNQARGLFCGIGHCTDCIMTVNGLSNVRTCVTPVEEGMVIETQYGNGRLA